MDDLHSKINELYKKTGYLDKYGGSLFITFILLIVFFILYAYFYVTNNTAPIKADWQNQKCNPAVIPFAGFINGDPNMSKFEYTGKNFNSCITNILTSITGEFLKPFTQMGNVAGSSIKGILGSVQAIRVKLSEVTKNVANIDNEIMAKIYNFVMPIQYMLIKMKDILARTQATLLTTVYTSLAGFLALKSFIANFVNIIIASLVVLAGLIITLIFSFFGIPYAIALIAIFTAIAIPTGIVVGKLSHIVDMTNDNIPDTPSVSSCFDEDTLIQMSNGTKKKIKDLHVNEILHNGSIVTAKMKLSAKNIKMYNYKGVTVSGTHSVYIDNKWIKVDKLEESILIENYDKEFIYCFNTDKKFLVSNGIVFCDWDEINDENIKVLYNKVGKYFTRNFKKKDIHKYLDGGFLDTTNICMADKTKKPIKDVKVGDVLLDGSVVYGLVEVTTNNMNVYKNYMYNVEFIGAPNLQVYNMALGHFKHFRPICEEIPRKHKPHRLLHLLTDTKKVIIDNAVFYDYNGCIDVILDF